MDPVFYRSPRYGASGIFILFFSLSFPSCACHRRPRRVLPEVLCGEVRGPSGPYT